MKVGSRKVLLSLIITDVHVQYRSRRYFLMNVSWYWLCIKSGLMHNETFSVFIFRCPFLFLWTKLRCFLKFLSKYRVCFLGNGGPGGRGRWRFGYFSVEKYFGFIILAWSAKRCTDRVNAMLWIQSTTRYQLSKNFLAPFMMLLLTSSEQKLVEYSLHNWSLNFLQKSIFGQNSSKTH